MPFRCDSGPVAPFLVACCLIYFTAGFASAQDWHPARPRPLPTIPSPPVTPELAQSPGLSPLQDLPKAPLPDFSTITAANSGPEINRTVSTPIQPLVFTPPVPQNQNEQQSLVSFPLNSTSELIPVPGTAPETSQSSTPPNTGVGPPYGPIGTTPQGDKAPFLGWDNGFYIRSADQQFRLRITGQLQADFRGYLDDNAPRDVTEFLIRRARFGLEATVFQYYEFRFLPDFGVGQTRLQDAYINVHYIDDIQFTGGKFKQPFSYEQLIQDRFTPLMERSLIDQLVPQRDVGLMVHGQNLLGGRLDYGLAISNGEQNGDSDTNSSKDLNARIAIRPFASLDNFLKRLQFGVAGGFGVETETMNPSTLQTPLGVPFMQFKSTAYANGLRDRWSPEIAYFYGSFGCSAQYFQMEQKIQQKPGASPSIRVPFEGFYVQSTYLLSGETRTGYSQQISPTLPYDPCMGLSALGAWELVGRLSRLQVGAEAFAPGNTQLVNPSGNSSGATELTVGYNWYLNSWVRVQFNFEHAWFDQPVRLGAAGPEGLHSHTDTVAMRLQFVF